MKFKIKDRNYLYRKDEDIPLVEVGIKEKLIDIWDYTFHYPFHWYIKNPYRDHLSNPWKRIKTIIDYVPILWYDYDWDYNYIFKLLEKKLKRMYPHFVGGHFVSSNRQSRDIKLCLLLLNRIIENDYSSHTDKLDKKYGESKFKFEKLEKTDSKGRHYSILVNLNLKRDSDQYRKEFRRAIHAGERQRKQDIEYLFHIMNRKILKWWE